MNFILIIYSKISLNFYIRYYKLNYNNNYSNFFNIFNFAFIELIIKLHTSFPNSGLFFIPPLYFKIFSFCFAFSFI